MFQIEWARFSALHPCKLRTYHLTISTPLGLTRTILSRLNVISASNNYLLLEKKFAKGQEPTGAFDFKACLVILEFQLGKEICSYPLRAGHSAGILMAAGWWRSVKRERALWWEKLPGSSPSKRLRLHLPWMLENSSKSLSRHPAETLLVSASREFKKRNMNFPGSTMLRIFQGKAQRVFLWSPKTQLLSKLNNDLVCATQKHLSSQFALDCGYSKGHTVGKVSCGGLTASPCLPTTVTFVSKASTCPFWGQPTAPYWGGGIYNSSLVFLRKKIKCEQKRPPKMFS